MKDTITVEFTEEEYAALTVIAQRYGLTVEECCVQWLANPSNRASLFAFMEDKVHEKNCKELDPI